MLDYRIFFSALLTTRQAEENASVTFAVRRYRGPYFVTISLGCVQFASERIVFSSIKVSWVLNKPKMIIDINTQEA
jgi:hypothetical protein